MLVFVSCSVHHFIECLWGGFTLDRTGAVELECLLMVGISNCYARDEHLVTNLRGYSASSAFDLKPQKDAMLTAFDLLLTSLGPPTHQDAC